ncbi:hypothetical protein B0J13DRAFT_54717 [Dactylonectria estremocensis]|uniref:Uncharacterized protein n=1 Tax=Dactylonectria estremocensis TaxID=1079267 RepID=A0A9P9ENA4_9HYPO|nr:hypothetical protein B0J13DRAFT_54717 [Dactylonectria estremocensis]
MVMGEGWWSSGVVPSGLSWGDYCSPATERRTTYSGRTNLTFSFEYTAFTSFSAGSTSAFEPHRRADRRGDTAPASGGCEFMYSRLLITRGANLGRRTREIWLRARPYFFCIEIGYGGSPRKKRSHSSETEQLPTYDALRESKMKERQEIDPLNSAPLYYPVHAFSLFSFTDLIPGDGGKRTHRFSAQEKWLDLPRKEEARQRARERSLMPREKTWG